MMSLKGWPHGIHLVLQHSPLDVYLNEKLKTNTHRHSQYVLFDASLKTFLGKPSGTKPRLRKKECNMYFTPLDKDHDSDA